MADGRLRSPSSAAVVSPTASTAIIAAIIVGALYLGQEILVPIALAILLSFVLAPLVSFLEDWHFPRPLAVLLTAAVAFLAIFVIGSLIASQVTQLAQRLPEYQTTMRDKIASLRGLTATGPLERAADILQGLNKELNKPSSPTVQQGGSETTEDVKPLPVEVRSPPPTALESLLAVLQPLLHPLTTVGVVIVFVLFILFQREDLRNRLIRLAGARDLQKTTAAIDDAAGRLSRLFLTQLGLNTAFGLAIGTGLWVIGVPSAILWGILAAILRFVPYIGAPISAVIPLILAAAVDPGWSMLLWTAAMILGIELIVGQVIEPMLYGHSSGLSPVAVVVSATFWTSLWGPIGLVLATPLTICLVVLGRHVEKLEFLDILLGDQPALSPPEIFYQRMLADDPDETVDKAELFLRTKPLSQYYEEVALKGLQLAQIDILRGTLAPDRVRQIREAVEQVVDDLQDEPDAPKPMSRSKADHRRKETAVPADGGADDKRVLDIKAADARATDLEDDDTASDTDPMRTAAELPVLTPEELIAAWQSEQPVLCLPERNDLDEAAAHMLAQILTKHGLGSRVGKRGDISPAGMSRLGYEGVTLVCLSAFDNTRPAHTRLFVRRLRRIMPDARILLVYWMMDEHTTVTAESLNVDAIVSTLYDATHYCLNAARHSEAARSTPPRLTSVSDATSTAQIA